MSRSGAVEIEWGGRLRVFRLGVAQWRDIQEKCDAGPAEIARRLAAFDQLRKHKGPLADAVGRGMLGEWRIDDVREVIRLGLVGGGLVEGETPVSRGDAEALVREYVDKEPWVANLGIASTIVMCSIFGTGDEVAAGEPKGGPGTETGPPLNVESSDSAKTGSTP